MNKTWLGMTVTAFALAVNAPAFAQQKTMDEGKKEFELRCAACHGVDGKGNGMVGAALKVAPPDITMLSKSNGGVFPIERITQIIDGRAQIAAHGSRDMPVWGTLLAVEAAEHYVDIPYNQEQYIRDKILRLTDYIHRVQQK